MAYNDDAGNIRHVLVRMGDETGNIVFKSLAVIVDVVIAAIIITVDVIVVVDILAIVRRS